MKEKNMAKADVSEILDSSCNTNKKIFLVKFSFNCRNLWQKGKKSMESGTEPLKYN